MKVKAIIDYGLQPEWTKASGLKWLDPGQVFALNSEVFLSFFQRMGNSSVKWECLRNTLCKRLTGFEMMKIPSPPGYNYVYKYPGATDFNIPVVNNGESANHPVYVASSLPVDHANSALHHASTNTNSSYVWSVEEINLIKTLLFDDALASLLLKKQPDVQNFIVNADSYFRDLHEIFLQEYPGWVSKTDLENWLILIDNERENELGPYISTTGLARFSKRFGPWTEIISKVRDFISSNTDGRVSAGCS